MNKSYGLKVTFNNKAVINAGIEKENYVVIGILTFVSRNDGSGSYDLNIIGMDLDLSDHLLWYSEKVGLGDMIILEVIKGPFDQPIKRYKYEQSEEEALKHKLEEYHYLKNKLKDHI